MIPLTVEIRDDDDIQYLPPFWGLQVAKRFKGGEDHWLRFNLPYPADLDYPEIAYNNEVKVYLGIQPVWIGRMRKVEQHKALREHMIVRCFGNWALLDDFSYGGKGKLWSETDYREWEPTTRDLKTNRRPHRYEMDTQNRLWICPREGEYSSSSAGGALYYHCPYDDVKKVKFTVEVGSFSGWDAMLRSFNKNWGSGNTEWQHSVDGVGAQTITLSTERPVLEFNIWKTSAGTYADDTGDTYLKITDLEIYGSTDISITMDDVAKDIVAQVESETSIENDENLIEAISNPIPCLQFKKAETCLDALEEMGVKYGDTNQRLVGYGVEAGGYRVYVRKPDRRKIRYEVQPGHATRISRQGALPSGRKGYLSEAWGEYVDNEGLTQYTDKYYVHVTSTGLTVNTTSTGDDLASAKWGKRSGVVPLGRMASAQAIKMLKRILKEVGHPKVTSAFQVVGQIKDLQRGGYIHPLEMEMGNLVRIPYFRAVEAEGASGDDLRDWDTTFLLEGLEYRADTGVARLFPEQAEDDSPRLLAYIRKVRQERGR